MFHSDVAETARINILFTYFTDILQIINYYYSINNYGLFRFSI